MSKKSTCTRTEGIVYLVGAGPGDPGLLTVRGKECIEMADVLVYDYLSNAEFLRLARADAEKIYAGKKAKDHTLTQDQINALIVEKAKEGKIVTRLKGGDPVLFGRGAEEAAELAAAGVRYEIVPGVSSSIAGPIYAGIPVTHRSHASQLTIFTGHEDPTKTESSLDYAHLARTPGTRVMLMGVERMMEITGELMKHGAASDTPVALVRWATRGNQQTLTGTLGDIAEKVKATGFKAPAVCVIGDVVKERERINWFEDRPLFGKRIVVTRTRHQAGGLTKELSQLGADVIELPTIKIVPPANLMEFGQLVQDCHKFEWIVFTSPNGVDAFFEMFFKLYDDARAIGGAKIAAIGPGTADKVKQYHLAVDLMPEKYVAESLVKALIEKDVENQLILWVRAEGAREVIAKELNKARAIVDEGIAYRTIPEREDNAGAIARLKEEGADVITFTSSSTVDCFFDLGLELPAGIKVASIGPITSQTLRARGVKIDIEATEFSIPGLVAAIRKYFA
ncbi:MAG: uroporphyrinogen-III C-methyltransferase [Verrucomicrobiaceae bacterium]|nr:uroporphyrinogen-III C-methyltransferase [Verrucomicrobiaceae bacterium]